MKESKQELGDFDPLVVHRRDGITGKLVSVKHFKMIAHKGVRFYEYPKGSSNLWYEDRTHAGRLNELGEPVRGAAHESWTAPMTQDQKIGQDNQVLSQENVRLMAELSAIKKEQEMEKKLAKATPVQGKPTAPISKK